MSKPNARNITTTFDYKTEESNAFMNKNNRQIYNEYSTLEDEGFPRYSNQELTSSKIRNENKEVKDYAFNNLPKYKFKENNNEKEIQMQNLTTNKTRSISTTTQAKQLQTPFESSSLRKLKLKCEEKKEEEEFVNELIKLRKIKKSKKTKKSK